MSNDKIWAYSNTGNLAHAFVQVWADKDGVEHPDHLRAMCRKTIARPAFGPFNERKNMLLGLCVNCVKLADARQARIQDADQPPTEADDLGYVPTGDADSLDNEQREGLQAGFDAAVAAHQAAETVTIGGQPVETLADAETRLVQELRAEALDAAHAEALEMDAAGEALTAAHADALTLLEPEAEPIRWYYRAYRQTLHGAFPGVLGVLEGYVTLSGDVPPAEVERRIRVAYAPSSGVRLLNFVLRKA